MVTFRVIATAFGEVWRGCRPLDSDVVAAENVDQLVDVGILDGGPSLRVGIEIWR